MSFLTPGKFIVLVLAWMGEYLSFKCEVWVLLLGKGDGGVEVYIRIFLVYMLPFCRELGCFEFECLATYGI